MENQTQRSKRCFRKIHALGYGLSIDDSRRHISCGTTSRNFVWIFGLVQHGTLATIPWSVLTLITSSLEKSLRLTSSKNSLTQFVREFSLYIKDKTRSSEERVFHFFLVNLISVGSPRSLLGTLSKFPPDVGRKETTPEFTASAK